MALANYVGKKKCFSYDEKDYPHSEWVNHLAYKAPKLHSKLYNGDTSSRHWFTENDQCNIGDEDAITNQNAETIVVNVVDPSQPDQKEAN